MKRIASIPLLLSLCWSTQSLGGDVNTPMPNKGGETNAPSETQEESSRSGNPEKSATEPRPLLPPQFGIYGFARLDAVYSSGKMAHPQVGFWALSADAPLSDESTFSVYPRYSRLGLTWDDTVETQAGGIRVSAKTEIDFFGGGSESDALPRMRVAYGDVQWRALSLRAGQDWDLFSPLFTGGLQQAAFWNGGNLGDRRPQFRVTVAPKWGDVQLVMAGAALQSGVVDNADVDADGRVDGVAWGAPAAEALMELKLAAGAKKRAIRVGVSGHYGGKRIEVNGERRDFAVEGINAHLEVPIGPFTFAAEAWMGRNMSDLRGGIGQGVLLVPIAGDADVVQSRSIAARGGWANVYVDPVHWLHFGGGLGIDAPTDVPIGARQLNRTCFGQVSLRLWKSFEATAGYDLYRTEYRVAKNATVHRALGYTAVHF